MRLIFKRIEIHNFLSFEDEIFEFDKHIGLNLVCGKNNDIPGSKNGTGKSNVFSSLCFALFGQTQNNLKNCNICNKYVNSKEVRVILTFDVEDKHYKVISGFNKYGAPYCKLSELMDDNEEVDLTKSSIIETRKFIETDILHCDMSIFLRTILLSSDQNYNFYKLSKYEKKQFIEKLFDIQVFGQLYANIHKDILNYDKTILASQNKLLLLNKQDSEYKQRIEHYEKTKQDNINSLNARLEDLKTKQLELKNAKLDKNESEVAKYENAIDLLNKAILKNQTELRTISTELSKIEIQIHKLNSSKESKQKTIDKHSELLNKLCDDCKIIFSDYYNITIYKTEIDEINKKISSLSEIQTEKTKLSNTISEKQQLIDKKIQLADSKIKELTAEYNKATKLLAQSEAQIQSLEKEIIKTENTKNPYSELYESNKNQLEKETNELTEISEKYKYLKFAENIVSQDTLRKFIISDLIWLLNNKIKMYLTKFGAKYSVQFDSDMNYDFITEAGSYEYSNFSAGERARLMIATCFAFRDFMYIRNNLSSNILILDEFIDGAIDGLAIESILNIMKDFCRLWKQNIYIISHRKSEIDNTAFDNIIQVVKTNNISKITYLESTI